MCVYVSFKFISVRLCYLKFNKVVSGGCNTQKLQKKSKFKTKKYMKNNNITMCTLCNNIFLLQTHATQKIISIKEKII